MIRIAASRHSLCNAPNSAAASVAPYLLFEPAGSMTFTLLWASMPRLRANISRF
jgi:hypothetical protein